MLKLKDQEMMDLVVERRGQGNGPFVLNLVLSISDIGEV